MKNYKETIRRVSTEIGPDGLATVIVLDAVEDVPEPDYCIHGRATCMGPACEKWVWLGHASIEIVSNGEALPICGKCALMMVPKDAEPIRNAHDNKRADGPHE